MKVFVSAAEISSDIHAEKILKALQKKLADQKIAIQWMGIGGPLVSALPGFVSLESAENLRTMGFIEVLKRIRFFQKLLHKTAVAISKFNPDLIITFDYPDFHFRLMEKVVQENLAPSALRVCGIPPKVWVWRSHRVEKIRRLYHGVWVIFPFEQIFYQKLGIPVIYEGNPLLETLMAKRSGVSKKPLETITVMPGSRDAELKYHLPIIPETLERFAKKIGKKVTAQVPVPRGVSLKTAQDVLKNTELVEYSFLFDGSAISLNETQLGLIKSGTSTLEAAMLECIPVIFYKMNGWSEQIFRWFIQTWGGYWGPVGLPNILLGVTHRKNAVFPEFLGPEATPERLSEALLHCYQNAHLRQEALKNCSRLNSLFLMNPDGVRGEDAATRSASGILSWKKSPPVSVESLVGSKKFYIWMISWVWSSINFLRRRLANAGLLPVYQVKTPSILVGNLQAGGAGKTPIVIALASEAIAKGKKVAVVSRGYGRSAANPIGDEPQEILNAVPGVILFVDANRVKAVQEAEKHRPDLIIFDDGFQNLKFRSRFNLIAVTDRSRSQIPFRDFDGELQFADLVLATKGSSFRPSLRKASRRFIQVEWEWIQPVFVPVWVLCSIADPVELLGFYRERGLIIKKLIAKPDHAPLDPLEVAQLQIKAKAEGCRLAITEKDRVKIPSLSPEVVILKRAIKNRDWMDEVFASKLERDESL